MIFDKKRIKIFNSFSELSVFFCEELLKLSLGKESIFLALSGGSTPKIILQTLAKDYKVKINWNKTHLFWGDDRCVPPEDEVSNYGMTKKFLLDYIDIPQENVHRIKGEAEPFDEAERYSKEIKNNVPFYNDLPLFNIVMLGVGEDGHTASIFPNQMNLLNSKKICEVAIHPSSGQKRITLTGKVINNAERIIFLVTGKSKSKIIKELLEGEDKEKYPAAQINSFHGKTDYFIDREAANLLNRN
jgi:6-phosphogluconolactonase